jgi:arginyl-tRNA synthetase
VIDIKKEIALVIGQSLAKLTSEKVNFLVEEPENESFGDYSSNVALVTAKILKKNPLDLAEELVEKIDKSKLPEIENIEVVKPGFINFHLSEKYLFSQLEKILKEKETFGSKNIDLNKKVVVEYSSPNIAKPFTVGHLRSTIIGDAIANLLEANGWKVYRDNHLGDWGTQFGKQIYAIKNLGGKNCEDEIERSENPVKELVNLYVKFHDEAEKNPELEEKAREWFKKLENGDLEARRLWKKCVDWSWKEFAKIYKELGIEFTENGGLGFGESFFEDKIKPVIEELREKNLLKKSEDAELVFYPNDKFPPLMILKKDGATLYSTRDLATDKYRLNNEEYGKDVVIVNEVGNEQSLYFRQLFELEKMLGWVKDGQRIHIKHGLYRFKDAKMSTRKGNTIWLEDVLKEAEKRALNLQSHYSGIDKDQVITISQKKGISASQHILGYAQRINLMSSVGIGAIKWNDLKRTPEQDIVFDWDEILNMEGNSGPYVQYAYVRTQSVRRKAEAQDIDFESMQISTSSLEPEELSLMMTIHKFSGVVQKSAENFAPNILCNYLFDLAQKFNLFYQKCKIIGSEQQNSRLSLTMAVGAVLENGLNLLGIQAPKQM